MGKPQKVPARSAAPHAESRPRTAAELIAKAKRMSADAAKQQKNLPGQSVKDLLARSKALLNPKKSTHERGD
jgi:hypothetical protein